MPQKIGIVKKFRDVSDLWVLRLPMPNINPSIITLLAIPFSIAFIFLWEDQKAWAIILLFCCLLSDWLDGIIARHHHRASEKGWFIDVITDRISEGIIFSIFFWPWFYLFILNILLNFISYFIKKNLTMPLRFAFFIYIIILYTYNYFQ